MKITVTKKNQYGNERIFPVDENAALFADLIGKQTFQQWQLDHIKKLGFTIEHTNN